MVAKGYKSEDVVNPWGGYWKQSAVITHILDHKKGHYVRLNKVALKYPNFKKDVNPNAYVIVFNSVIEANAKTFENIFQCF
jgi:hypothetical protein